MIITIIIITIIIITTIIITTTIIILIMIIMIIKIIFKTWLFVDTEFFFEYSKRKSMSMLAFVLFTI